ncbi:HotDog domain-containing protein [Exophiala viscosa]|uniref:HotDog domain-containing protein n=1 Tax=Exophiala viscosa TaxID=2486360 RepID=A0AAN6E6E5_9EURO|nr:HotDog domain-containing protein [Exophiala viscosa]
MPDRVADLEVFESIPWCQPILQDPDFELASTWSRTYVAESRENELLGHTLKNDNTIRGWISLYNRPTQTRPLKDEVHTLMSLDQGLNGYPRVIHGGITATILDEVQSILVSVCLESAGLSPDNVTADLRITYLKPIVLPCVVLIKAKIKDIKGRKYFADAEIVNEKAVVLARGEGLFVTVGREKL